MLECIYSYTKKMYYCFPEFLKPNEKTLSELYAYVIARIVSQQTDNSCHVIREAIYKALKKHFFRKILVACYLHCFSFLPIFAISKTRTKFLASRNEAELLGLKYVNIKRSFKIWTISHYTGKELKPPLSFFRLATSAWILVPYINRTV